MVAASIVILLFRPLSWPLQTWGLVYSFLGAMVMAFTAFKPERVIRSMATMAAIIGGYTDHEAVRVYRRDKYFGVHGMSLMALGFLLQLA